jgi:hypothetical protein
MKKPLIMIVFVLTAAAQLLVPASMVVKREATLREGKVFKFRTTPVDPYDAFRGRYVALSYEQDRITKAEQFSFKRGQKVFAVLSEDEEGYAQMVSVWQHRPEDLDYLEVEVRSGVSYETNVLVRIRQDRFYMEENAAPKAEAAYQAMSSSTNRNAHVQMRIRDGFGVIEELFIDDLPVREYLNRQQP